MLVWTLGSNPVVAGVERLNRRYGRCGIRAFAVVNVTASSRILRVVKGWLYDLGFGLDDFAAQAEHDGPGLVVQLLLPPVRHRRLLGRYRELADRPRLALELRQLCLVGRVLVVNLLDVVP
jgi:hypothetical protein